MQFTKAQEAAMTARGRTLLVSAAAGSGKTFTLTQRIIRSIIEEGRDISRLLIVTFTRAAAGELRSKISKALSEAIAENPGNAHLQKQLLLLGSAKISTIDSFFSEPVRANFEKLGLPASMRLADEAELSPIRESAMKEVLDRFYEGCEGLSEGRLSEVGQKERFTDLVGIISAARDSSNLIPTLLEIYGKLITAPEGVGRLQKATERLRAAASTDFFKTAEGGVIRDKLKELVDYTAAAFGKCCDEMAKDPILCDKYIPCFDQNKTLCVSLSEILKQGSYEEVRAAFDAYAPSRIPSLRGNEKSETAERYKDLRGKKLNPAIKSAAKTYLSMTQGEIAYCFAESAEFCMMISRILTEYERIYSEEKLRRGLCEFSDMPKFMLRLLSDENKQPTEYARHLSESFDEVYIDEYQDVNEIQDRIFELIGGNRRFMVGDIKQSIYGFRDAVPELFSGYRDAFPKHDDPAGKNSDGCTIFMSENFRCDTNVIDFSNTVCAFLFEAAGKSLNYQKEDDLKFGKINIPDGYVPPKVQINIVEDLTVKPKKGEKTDDTPDAGETAIISAAEEEIPREIILCAKEIARLLKEEVKLNPDYDPKDPNHKEPPYKSISPNDIAILVAKKKYAPVFAKALKKYGVSYHMSAISQLFDGEDMKALLFLLKVIDNPLDDVSLSGFLTASAYCGSPMFTLTELITMHRHSKGAKTLYDSVRQYGKHGENDPLGTLLSSRAREVIKLIGDLRAYSRRVSVEKLLKHIATNENFSLICETDAYVYLYDTACNYVKNSWSGLYSFLKVFKKLAENGDASFKDATPAEAVNIMTIHQSKGLERHAIFLYKAEEDFPDMDASDRLNYKAGLGCAMKLPTEVVDEDGNSAIEKYESSIVRDAIIEKIRQDKALEQMRVLYVALTRARERLYISASIKGTFEDYKNKLRMNGTSSYAKLACKNFLSWITMSLIDQSNNINPDSFVINRINAADIDPNEVVDLTEAILSENNLSEEEKKYVDIIKNSRKATEGNEDVTIPSKVAASKVSDTLFDFVSTNDGLNDSVNKEAIEERLKLLRSNSKNLLKPTEKTASAADIGTATHAFLQFCEFVELKNNGVEKEIERLVKEEYITAEDAELVDRQQIDQFVMSDLFELILSARNIRREFRFGLFVDAKDFAKNKDARSKLDGKKVYVQGSIDILMEADDGDIYICDYKTDRIGEGESIDKFKTRLYNTHKHQLEQYKNAISTIYKKAPQKILIYSLPLGEAIEIKV